jgi:hypothetical protein
MITIQTTGCMRSCVIPAMDENTLLVFESFHSEDKKKLEPSVLPEEEQFGSKLRIVQVIYMFIFCSI